MHCDARRGMGRSWVVGTDYDFMSVGGRDLGEKRGSRWFRLNRFRALNQVAGGGIVAVV